MTIFDVIRYPISEPPTLEEFNRLPTDLYINWIKNSDWCNRWIDNDPPRYTIANWYAEHWDRDKKFFEISKKEFDTLRKMIAEYNGVVENDNL